LIHASGILGVGIANVGGAWVDCRAGSTCAGQGGIYALACDGIARVGGAGIVIVTRVHGIKTALDGIAGVNGAGVIISAVDRWEQAITSGRIALFVGAQALVVSANLQWCNTSSLSRVARFEGTFISIIGAGYGGILALTVKGNAACGGVADVERGTVDLEVYATDCGRNQHRAHILSAGIVIVT